MTLNGLMTVIYRYYVISTNCGKTNCKTES